MLHSARETLLNIGATQTELGRRVAGLEQLLKPNDS